MIIFVCTVPFCNLLPHHHPETTEVNPLKLQTKRNMPRFQLTYQASVKTMKKNPAPQTVWPLILST